MPRPRRSTAAPPRRLNDDERHDLQWNMNDAIATNGHDDHQPSNGIDNGHSTDESSDSDDLDGQPSTSTANNKKSKRKRKAAGGSKTKKKRQKQLADDDDESQSQRPKMEFPLLSIRILDSCYDGYVCVNLFDPPRDEVDDDEFAFPIFEFTIAAMPTFENFHAELRRLVREKRQRSRVPVVVKLYFRRPQHRPPAERYDIDYFLYAPSLMDRGSQYLEHVPCRLDGATIDVVREFHQKTTASLRLIYDEQLSTIRVWVGKSMISDRGTNGIDVSTMSAAHFRRLMPVLMPEVFADEDRGDGGSWADCRPKNIAVAVAKDDPHELYERLKPLHESMRQRQRRHSSSMININHPAIIPQLRPYQKEAVRWLLERELEPKSMENDMFVEIPLTIDHQRPTKMEKVYFNRIGGYFTRNEPSLLFAPIRGGILAEEMGLGKTVEMLSLILLNPKEKTAKMEGDGEDGQEGWADEILNNSLNEDLIKTSDTACRLETEQAFREKAVQESLYHRERKAMFRRRRAGALDPGRRNQEEVRLHCSCGRRWNEMDPSPRIECSQCSTWQHVGCVGWTTDKAWARGDNAAKYECPHCRCTRPESMIDSKTTLIISPASISDQWYAEILKHVRKDALSIYIYRGVQNEGFVQPYTLAEYDVVIVAYETLRTELDYLNSVVNGEMKLRRPKRFANAPSPLAAVRWWRLCVDEAQMVENALAKAAAMCLRLEAKYKWCVTGTPIQKSIDDLYGLFLLLDVDPYSIRHFWTSALYTPYVDGAPDGDRLVRALAPILWRTSKSDVVDQLRIPDQEHRLRWIEFGAIEEHFYQRTQAEYRDEFRRVLATVGQLDLGTRLVDLQRATVEKLLTPLLRLRQACCHPQLVRGGRFVNFDQIQNRTRVVTMDEILAQMIRKTRLECEEFHRSYVLNLNGLAGFDVMRGRWPEAAERYREVLRSCLEYDPSGGVEEEDKKKAITSSNVRTDPLQRICALHNLNELIKTHRAAIPPTCRDEELGAQLVALKERFLLKYVANFAKARTDYDAIRTEYHTTIGADFTPDWCVAILRTLRENPKESPALLDRLKQSMLDKTKWTDRFDHIDGLLYLITTHLDGLMKSHDSVADGIGELLERIDEDETKMELIDDARNCHLPEPRPNLVYKCRICRLESRFDEYALKLFDRRPTIPAVENRAAAADHRTGPENTTGLEGESDLEKTTKLLYQFVSRSHRRQLISGDRLESARRFLKCYDTIKRDYHSMRDVWRLASEHIAQLDEIRQAETIVHVPDVEIRAQRMQFGTNATIAHGSLRRQMGQFKYLLNLKSEREANNGDDQAGPSGVQQRPTAESTSIEECPICLFPLGKSWIVLTTCGHSMCDACHRRITPANAANSRCPICRRTTPKLDVRTVVCKKSSKDKYETERRERAIERYPVRGVHSAKITEIVRCLLEIADHNPTSKSLIFSNWSDVLQLVSYALVENGIRHAQLKSSSGEKFRRDLTEFKTSNQCNVLLLPFKNGANGLNLIEATHVLLLDQTMNPAQEQQALGRVHRIGQSAITYVHRFLVRRTVEEKIHAALGDRVVKIDEVLLDESTSNETPTSLSLGDLVEFFSGDGEDDGGAGAGAGAENGDMDEDDEW